MLATIFVITTVVASIIIISVKITVVSLVLIIIVSDMYVCVYIYVHK